MRYLALLLVLVGCTAPDTEPNTPEENSSSINTPSIIVTVPPDTGTTDNPDEEPVEPDTATAEPEELVYGFLETACGHSVGENACDFRLKDQNDAPWRLSDYAGDVVLLDLSAMWCAPCQAAAVTAQSTQDDYSAQGFHYVTILIVDSTNDTMELSEAQDWAASFGIVSAPVLQGNRDLLQSGGAAHGYPLTSWPTFIVIDRTQTVASGLRGFNEEYIRQMIEDAL